VDGDRGGVLDDQRTAAAKSTNPTMITACLLQPNPGHADPTLRGVPAIGLGHADSRANHAGTASTLMRSRMRTSSSDNAPLTSAMMPGSGDGRRAVGPQSGALCEQRASPPATLAAGERCAVRALGSAFGLMTHPSACTRGRRLPMKLHARGAAQHVIAYETNLVLRRGSKITRPVWPVGSAALRCCQGCQASTWNVIVPGW
jgi:hypothetical protein